MAAISFILGGIVGFVGFILTLWLTDLGLGSAFGVYFVTGLAAAGLFAAYNAHQPKSTRVGRRHRG